MKGERPALRGLYAITPVIQDTAGLVAKVRACLEGGAALVQYRAKDLAPGLALVQARAILAVCHEHHRPLIVNDSVELAAAIGADGVHLGRDDVDVREARIVLPHAIIGASCYADPERARTAAVAGADYVGIGSMFPSKTKPAAAKASLETIAAARSAGGLPVAAIGGIDAMNAPAAVAAGADMLAVISALFDAPDVRAAAEQLARLFKDPPGEIRHVRTQPRAV
jgi:thiamine-phosphate pyrophosphorylase